MKKMFKVVRSAAAIGLAGIMMAGTAYAGTWEVNTFSPITPLDGYSDGQFSYKTYTGFADDRNQAALIDKNWRYKKDDGSYALSEWIEDETGKYYTSESGLTYVGYWGAGAIDSNAYFFEPSDGHMITDSILEANSINVWDVPYTLNADGTWDPIPADLLNLADYQSTVYFYFDENGVQVVNGKVPGGQAVGSSIQNVNKGIDENGIPYLTVGDVRYVAVKSSSLDRTYNDSVENTSIPVGAHEFYTVYARQK